MTNELLTQATTLMVSNTEALECALLSQSKEKVQSSIVDGTPQRRGWSGWHA